ncbi:hypothetical protein PMSD_00785 [Paenibacillus macquariensis subsp. defensor]|nr:hypothetical protein PMSD_00785 [Paenibacillus macquariensis subsp. defensor]
MPLRAARDGMKANVTWDQKTKTATLTKDGITLKAKVGQFVKLFDGRVYVQFREVSDTLYNKELIIWDKSGLIASSDHFILNLRPLKDDEVQKIMTAAIMNNKAAKSFFEEIPNNYNTHIVYSGLEKLTALFSVEYTDSKGDNYRSQIERVMVNPGKNWKITYLKQSKIGMLPPH